MGETSRNFYSRNIEHPKKYKDEKADSFIFDHQKLMHHGQTPDMNMKVGAQPSIETDQGLPSKQQRQWLVERTRQRQQGSQQGRVVEVSLDSLLLPTRSQVNQL